MPEAEILIVGGGPAGLSTAGALKQVGLEATILERGERVGQSWEQRYDRLHLHTVRAFSGLAHFPIPASGPKYLSRDEYAAYLRAYAAHFDLHFILNTPVSRVRPAQFHGQAGWAVETGSGTWLGRVVVIATGQFGQPVYPDGPGLAGFGGQALHSSQYRSGRAFQGQRVLVIGAGNSGTEIATDLVEQGAAKVAISLRAVPPVVPRDFLGIPAQMFGMLMSTLPPAFSDRVGQFFARLAFGDLRRYGLPAPDWGLFSARRPPVIDVGFVRAIKAGKLSIRPAVSAFTPGGVFYQDQNAESFDGLVFATGYRPDLENLLEPEGLLDRYGMPRSVSGAATACPGLYFMGFSDGLRGFLYECNLASRRLASEIRSYSG